MTVNATLRDRFERVANGRHWIEGRSISGPGSELGSYWAAASIDALQAARKRTGFRSMNDIPCGDFNWMPEYLKSAPAIAYHGFDIVSSLIERNRQRYPQFRFDTLDVTTAVPPYADLVFCKDLFNHLSYIDVERALDNMRACGALYLLVSNNFGHENTELPEGHDSGSRCLDLCAPPLNFHAPIWRTEYLGLWTLSGMSG